MLRIQRRPIRRYQWYHLYRPNCCITLRTGNNNMQIIINNSMLPCMSTRRKPWMSQIHNCGTNTVSGWNRHQIRPHYYIRWWWCKEATIFIYIYIILSLQTIKTMCPHTRTAVRVDRSFVAFNSTSITRTMNTTYIHDNYITNSPVKNPSPWAGDVGRTLNIVILIVIVIIIIITAELFEYRTRFFFQTTSHTNPKKTGNKKPEKGQTKSPILFPVLSTVSNGLTVTGYSWW